MNNSCQGCTKREVGCHSTCIEYLTFRKNLDKLNEQIKQAKYNRDIGITHRKGKHGR